MLSIASYKSMIMSIMALQIVLFYFFCWQVTQAK